MLSEKRQAPCFGAAPSMETSSSIPCNRSPAENHTCITGSISIMAMFIKLFEDYPDSRDFFTQFKGKPVNKIKSNVVLSKMLQSHSIIVFQLVEKVIGMMEPSIGKVCFLIWYSF